MATEALKTASVLAFERKLDPSDALLFAGPWEQRDDDAGWQPVLIREKSVRGTISNRLKTSGQDPAKLDAAIQNPNLQTVDVAALPADADTLKVQFTLRVLGGVGDPSACNDAGYRRKLLDTVAGYVREHGLGELARRYAANLANGRFLWRNRIGAEQAEVHVAHLQDGRPVAEWRFDALAHAMPTLAAPPAQAAAVSALAAVIEAGLAGTAHALLRVTAFVRLGHGQEVFPSQELILDRGRGDKSKTLYKIGDDKDAAAAIHSQKIGNALRTIDTWYPGADENGAIAVEPYGSVTTQGKAYRQPKEKQDFYTLLDAWVLKDKAPPVEQQHFVIATLVRGGVFGEAG
ncbi:type I-F CRISPR-associated protein Csy3 [Pseudoxanthomonas winnipegensis]|uniref:type I-F CRISPR-associated protein Csy3 n=1 Tax=Pseudoxanthomonas winnipegensis TaxID=2480810 RepID=UPI001039CD71|nr:type I-F CRISPR-associated protein Csy3 [Pseudoxanthomonas winnipegensis]TBV77099.1 type I-F CRISPR-associated protein Csy3 [Pseudoxanthomonas winnipegensis]